MQAYVTSHGHQTREGSDLETIPTGIYLECRTKTYTVEGKNAKGVSLVALHAIHPTVADQLENQS